ncbi:RNA polymerase sigma factor [Leptospira noguchii]|uniref:RNA polymerase sigma factor, sigma-70 family n=5 Tax=Leptospira noguchii TaxID=28182 RepID=M6VHX0_9LEPT|nr:sigma-70 family RNA polymerase sigma factor [Leptospira noguchii]EKR73136.1 RNA polymerase sigma factor, sigma-70 family [Leptospira noguchii str. 2006001870]EMN02844.1 RNA polymerase sigma factor, sigma-70 family [Leptospira noguchii str. 2007001578]EMO40235.1 RNA polymerase sigma factor, sigma-70 family [Leptospira noguchii serovar Autumnalis str. ZUN142]EMO52749.1 RNA polymerase sigma factor, sigma-70 family [Leptospira noguchii]EMO88764.1 RNA polymerase sigma factor, sigma-70 family [Le
MNLSKDKTLDLVSRCGDGEEDALRQFFEIYSEDIYNFPMKIFHLSEDDAGDFFIYAFERLKTGSRFGSFKGKSSFRTWFYSVLRNMLIDWQRTKRELKVTNLGKISKEGKEYATIEDEPDTRPEMQEEASEFSDRFNQALEEIGVDKRVIFKLSYIYYLNLNEDEVQYLLEKTGLSPEALKEKILHLRSELSNREEENIRMEDKITSLYLNILELKEKQQNTAKVAPILPMEVDKTSHALKKKYEQRKRLLEKKKKGHFLARTPYKEVAELIGISEGNVSVTLLRLIEKIQKKLDFSDLDF